MLKIEKVVTLSVGTAAVTVKVSGLAFLLQNRSNSATVYFKEQRGDGTAVTAANGYALGPGEETRLPLTALELSLAATAAGTDVRVLILDEE